MSSLKEGGTQYVVRTWAAETGARFQKQYEKEEL